MAAHRIRDGPTCGPEIAGRTVRVCQQLDAPLIFGDFLALRRLHAAAPQILYPSTRM